MLRTYRRITYALFLLLAATLLAARVDLGRFALLVALGIAAAKALLVAVYFMHLRDAPPAMRLFAGAALFWLLILFGLTGADYLTRS